MRTKIIFRPNLPAVVAIEASGVVTGSGDFQYTCTKNQIMWVSPEVHEQILKLNPNVEEPFTICQLVQKVGKQTHVSWHVAWPQTNPGELAVPKLPEPHPAPPVPSIAPVARLPIDYRDIRRREMTDFLKDALFASIDASVAAQSYASTQGLALKFSDGHVQDLASTAGINYTRENENRLRYPGRILNGYSNGVHGGAA